MITGDSHNYAGQIKTIHVKFREIVYSVFSSWANYMTIRHKGSNILKTYTHHSKKDKPLEVSLVDKYVIEY